MQNTPPLKNIIYIQDDNNLLQSLTTTIGYNNIYLFWLNGHRTNWNINTYNSLSIYKHRIFLYLVHCFLCCLNVGLEDWSQGYQIYDNLFDSNIILTLLLKICVAINNDPFTTKDCWLTTTEPNEDYLYVQTSKTINGHKKTFRVKAIRLLCGIYRRPCITNGNIVLQASHLCFMEKSCINPNHLWPETDQENKSRIRCFNGCAHYCPHNPKCIWTYYTGEILPHRNDPNRAFSKSDCDCTNVDCFFLNK